MEIEQQNSSKYRVWIAETRSEAFDVEAVSPEMALALADSGKAGDPVDVLTHKRRAEGVWLAADPAGPPLATEGSLDPDVRVAALESLSKG